MSKSLSKEVKIEVLKLYRSLLKLHQHKLPEDARVFGDYFLKSEFTMNYTKADSNQMKVFLNE
jgi:hypothetical protein